MWNFDILFPRVDAAIPASQGVARTFLPQGYERIADREGLRAHLRMRTMLQFKVNLTYSKGF